VALGAKIQLKKTDRSHRRPTNQGSKKYSCTRFYAAVTASYVRSICFLYFPRSNRYSINCAGAQPTDPVSTFSECVYTQQEPIVRRRILSGTRYDDFIALTNPEGIRFLLNPITVALFAATLTIFKSP
jgi:hypothetical protein